MRQEADRGNKRFDYLTTVETVKAIIYERLDLKIINKLLNKYFKNLMMSIKSNPQKQKIKQITVRSRGPIFKKSTNNSDSFILLHLFKHSLTIKS